MEASIGNRALLENDMKSWPVEKVCEFLNSINMEQYAVVIFFNRKVNGRLLSKLSDETLMDLGIENSFDRLKLLTEVELIKEPLSSFSDTDIRSWTVEKLCEFLKGINMTAYVIALFLNKQVKGILLSKLTEETLIDLGVWKAYDRLQLLDIVEHQQEQINSLNEQHVELSRKRARVSMSPTTSNSTATTTSASSTTVTAVGNHITSTSTSTTLPMEHNSANNNTASNHNQTPQHGAPVQAQTLIHIEPREANLQYLASELLRNLTEQNLDSYNTTSSTTNTTTVGNHTTTTSASTATTNTSTTATYAPTTTSTTNTASTATTNANTTTSTTATASTTTTVGNHASTGTTTSSSSTAVPAVVATTVPMEHNGSTANTAIILSPAAPNHHQIPLSPLQPPVISTKCIYINHKVLTQRGWYYFNGPSTGIAVYYYVAGRYTIDNKKYSATTLKRDASMVLGTDYFTNQESAFYGFYKQYKHENKYEIMPIQCRHIPILSSSKRDI